MPLLWLSLAFLLGLLAGSAWQAQWGVWAGLMGAGVLSAVFEGRLLRRFVRYQAWRGLARLPLGVLLAGFALGGLRINLAQPAFSPSDLAWYNERGEARIIGVINRPPDKREKSLVLQVEVESLAPIENGQAGQLAPVHGQALARVPLGGDWRYGDRVSLEGAPSAVDEESSPSYAAYLARQGISSILSYPWVKLIEHEAGSPILALLYDLRARGLQIIRQLWAMPEAALMEGILLGYDRNLPPSVTDAFQQTGTAHIIAISGFNISILAGLFARLFGRFSRRWLAVLLSLLAISFYTLLVGAQPSVVRAAIMGAVGLFGPLLGRRQVGANSLAFVAALMCLFEPRLPWDVSFQLSFAGTLGLVLFANSLLTGLTNLLAGKVPQPLARKIATPIAEYFLLTLAAQAATLPIIAFHFQRVSLSAVLANPLVLPVQPLVMILGGIALIAGFAWLPLGQLIGAVVWPLPAYTIRAVEAMATLPGGSLVTGSISLALAVLYYGFLFALAAGLLRPGWFKRWLAPGMGLILAVLLATGAWRGALAAPDGKLHLTLLGLPGGPAVVIRAPDGQTVLLNGSSDARALEDALARRLPPLGARLDALLVTTRYASPLTALATVVERFPVHTAVMAKSVSSGTARSQLVSALKAQGAQVSALPEGLQLELGKGSRLRLVTETKDGAALLVEWGSFRALLPGGVAPQTLARANEPDLQAPSLLLLTPADLEAQSAEGWQSLTPLITAWYQLGGVVELPDWLSLEQAGWLEVITDGSQVWVERGN